ncbi:MAG: formylmethanofuran dehydrogenase subunit C [Pirellulales bacterium]
MAVLLTYRAPQTVPVELAGITPDALRGKTLAEIERLEVLCGNRLLPLAELFDMAGDAADERLILAGDLSGVQRIGAGMTAGHLEVHGPAGRHLGSQLRGGRIVVAGDAGDFAGSELRGGLIHIRGSAGDRLGASYPGSPRGMTGGTILVDGDAGHDVGHALRRGLIAIAGNCGDAAARAMLAGTIIVGGDCGPRCGAGMRRGTLALLGPGRPEILPTFTRGRLVSPRYLHLLARYLRAEDFPALGEALLWPLERWFGDQVESARGELLVRAQ